MKITIFWRSEKEYNMTDSNGINHVGRTFQGFCEDGQARRFTSEINDYDPHTNAIKFDSSRCEEINLVPRIDLNGKIKWQEKPAVEE